MNEPEGVTQLVEALLAQPRKEKRSVRSDAVILLAQPGKRYDSRRPAQLGLSVVNGIVTRHNGKVDVDTAPGKGTEIRVTLPIT